METKAQRRDRIRKENREKVHEYLRTHPCVDCGETDMVVLQFDHLRDKVCGIGTMIANGYTWLKIYQEIEKCEVVCANDHQRRTAVRAKWNRLQHADVA